jgi:hypothetical protein
MKNASVTTRRRDTEVMDDGTIESSYEKYRSDGNHISVTERLSGTPDRRVTVIANDGTVISAEHARVTDVNGQPHLIVTRQTNLAQGGHRDGTFRDINRLYDPEHSSGGTTPFWWVNEREKATFDFSKVGSGGKSPGAMPDTPHTETGTPTSQRVLSQNDVLERYDEDSRNRAGGKALWFHLGVEAYEEMLRSLPLP